MTRHYAFDLRHSSGRKVRRERLKIIYAILSVFLRSLDPKTLCVGHWSAKGGFLPLDMASIASEAGLGQRCCERTLLYLKSIGFVSVFPPRHCINPVPYAGLRAVRAISPAFLEWAGLTGHLEQVRADAFCKSKVDGGQP